MTAKQVTLTGEDADIDLLAIKDPEEAAECIRCGHERRHGRVTNKGFVCHECKRNERYG